ncbi:MAG: hypothetical protein E3J96_04955 [Sulfurovum sp.]|nr:MAG: hypothetical protein E3J96_04955 [Sulfurovum sp.]
MIKKTKKALKGLGIISLLSTSALAIEISSPTQAVDIAGKQRMFTQRMLKDYAMVGMGNTFGKPDEDLKKVADTFQDHMESLLSYTKNDETKKSIEKVKTLWVPLQQTLSEAPSKEKVEKLQEDSETLLKAADDTTKLFAKESGKESGKIVNMAGRQRMLSQRMASLYMLKVWGVEDPKFKTKLDETMKLFKTSLAELEKSSLNTAEITALLAKVKRSFMFFEMMSRSSSKFVPTLIYKKSNDILKNMNSATQNYVALETK